MSDKEQYTVDAKTADMMLQNVFSACDTKPNDIPLEKIIERSKISFRTENILIVVTTILLLLTLISPLFFPHSKFLMSVDAESARPLTVMTHQMTENTFCISFDGNPLDVSKSYMESSEGTILTPSEYNRNTNTITFPYIENEYNIYVYDITGKYIHLLLSPHKLSK